MGKAKLLLVLIIGIMTLGLASIGIDVAAVEPSVDSITTVWTLTDSQDVYDLAGAIAESSGEAFTVTVANDITIEDEDFQGLGTVECPFIGTFDGGGYTITLSGSYGLFAVVGDVDATTQTTTIQNVKIATAVDKKIYREIDITGEGSMTGCLVCVAYNSTIDGCENLASFSKNGVNATNAVGGLVGYAENSTIKNCINKSASSENTNLEYFGGIVGYVKNSTIEDCSNEGTLEGSTTYSGGIVGWAYNLCSIKNCSNTADLTGDNTVAGIVGLASGASSGTVADAVSITTSYNLGTITGNGYDTGDYAAGIAGSAGNESNIDCCYNLGTISNTNTSANTRGKIAGIVGSSAGSITNCYNLGSIVMQKGSSSAYAAGIVAELKGTPSIDCVYHVANISVGGSVQAAPIVYSIEHSNSTPINNAYYVDTNAIFGDSEYGTKATIQEFSADQIEAFKTDDWDRTDVGLYPKLAVFSKDSTYKSYDWQYVPFAYLPVNGNGKNVLQLGQAQGHTWNYYVATRNIVGGNTELTDGLDIGSTTIAIDHENRVSSKEYTLIEFVYPFGLDTESMKEKTFTWHDDISINLGDYKLEHTDIICTYEMSTDDYPDYQIAGTALSYVGTETLGADLHTCEVTVSYGDWERIQSIPVEVVPRAFSITDFKLGDTALTSVEDACITEAIVYESSEVSTEKTVESTVWTKDEDYTISHSYDDDTKKTTTTVALPKEKNPNMASNSTEFSYSYEIQEVFKLDPSKSVAYTFSEDADFEVNLEEYSILSLLSGHSCTYALAENDDFEVTKNTAGEYILSKKDNTGYLDAGTYSYELTMTSNDVDHTENLTITVNQRELSITDFKLDNTLIEDGTDRDVFETTYVNAETSIFKKVTSDIFDETDDYSVKTEYVESDEIVQITITPKADGNATITNVEGVVTYDYTVTNVPYFTKDTFEVTWGDSLAISLDEIREGGDCDYVLEDDSLFTIDATTDVLSFASEDTNKPLGAYECSISLDCGDFTLDKTIVVSVVPRQMFCTDFIVDDEVFETEAEAVTALEQSFTYLEQDDLWQKVITSKIWQEGTDYAVEYAFDRLTYKATLTIKVLDTNETASEAASDLVYVYDVVCPYEFTQLEEPYVYKWQDIIALDLAIECGENTYTLLDATEENDNALFEIAGTTLQVKAESGDLLPNTYVCDVMITRGRFDKLMQVEVCVEKVAFELADFSVNGKAITEDGIVTEAVTYSGTEDSLYKEITSDRWDDREDYTLDMVFDEDTWETTIRIIPKLPSPYISDDANELTYVYKVNVPDFIDLYLNAGEEYSFPLGMDSVYFGTSSDGCVYSGIFEQFFVRQTGTYRFRASKGGVS